MKSAPLWDIFCKVVDNFGDIGVCWRLAADLAARGRLVRLWVDDPLALSWMAPGALQGQWPRIEVIRWEQSRDPRMLAGLPPAEVWIAGFGCEIPPEFVARRFSSTPAGGAGARTPPTWINLEYLSAESFARRAHGLPSPVMHGAAKGHTRFFYYPGFTVDSGGLLREPGLAARQANFNRANWLANHGIRWQGERLIALFCYEPPALAALLDQLRRDPVPTRLLVTHGRAGAALRRLQNLPDQRMPASVGCQPENLSATFLPALTQTDFDHLLWSCDLNFVRGEDSLVRAIWAGNPFIWQIYPQHDDAHHAKLEAFLGALDAPASWRLFHRVWNGIVAAPLPRPDLGAWGRIARQAREQLLGQSDLTTRLLKFIEIAQETPGFGPENR